MRLINIDSMSFEEFVGTCPKYAILSHVWGDDEISYREYCLVQEESAASADGESDARLKSQVARIKAKAGYRKVLDFARSVRRDPIASLSRRGLVKHVWIDTCCIDKSSSAELQEAINSMFQWYELAEICLAYLADVEKGDAARHLRASRWFRRGWTLQELLAPGDLLFLDRDWDIIGAKQRPDILQTVSEITGIETKFIRGTAQLGQACVAKKMSWMAERSTTRKEDLAYCLLGIFDIKMPMLYGEGERAFIRLQEEIMKVSDDSSILAWGYTADWTHPLRRFHSSQLMATSPYLFRDCRYLVERSLTYAEAPAFQVTQRGLVVHSTARVDPYYEDILYLVLGCGPAIDTEGSEHNIQAPADAWRDQDPMIVIPLIRSHHDETHFQQPFAEYSRAFPWALQLVSKEFVRGGSREAMCIPRSYQRPRLWMSIVKDGHFLSELGSDYKLLADYPPGKQRHSHKRRDSRIQIICLAKNESTYLVIYDQRLERTEDGAWSVFELDETPTLETTLHLVNHESARNKLKKSSLVGPDGSVLKSEMLWWH